MLHNARDPHQRDSDKPDKHHRAKEVPNLRGTLRLDCKQRQQDHNGGRNNIGLSAAPNRPTATMVGRCCFFTPNNAIKARIPPSPSLSTRMANETYFTVVMMKRVQSTSESAPSTTPASGEPSAVPRMVLKV